MALVAGTVGLNLMIAPTAKADPYCFSFGYFANCVEAPLYETPRPKQVEPLPVWFCSTVYTATAILTVIPSGTIATWIARIVFVPTLTCFWK